MSRIIFLSVLLAAVLPAPTAQAQDWGWSGPVYNQQAPLVSINGQPVAPEALASLGQVPAGSYWYDTATGAWGMVGGPTQGFLQPGLSVGAPLAVDASNGTTGVLLNGRNLPTQDLQYINQILGQPLSPGSYTLDAQGNLKTASGTVIANLRQQAPAENTPTPTATTSSTGTQSFPNWNISDSVPSGWRMTAQDGVVQTLVNNAGDAVIYAARVPASNQQQITAQLVQVFQEHSIPAQVVEPFSSKTISGTSMLSSTIASGAYKGQVSARLSGHGTALVVLGVGTGQNFTTVQDTTNQLVAQSKLGAPNVNTALVQQLAGTYVNYEGNNNFHNGGGTSRSSETFITFDGRGGYQTNNNSQVHASTEDPSLGNAPGWTDGNGVEHRSQHSISDINQTQGSGQYTVYGNTLILMSNGGVQAMELEVFSNGLKAGGVLWALE